MLKYLPNTLTVLRLAMALPLGLLILREQYSTALWVGLAAGLSDALDGFAARRLGYLSQLGALLDPIADKTLVTVTFVCLAQVEAIPWQIAAIVIGRDLVIIAGAGCYRLLIGPFDFGARPLSKLTMASQMLYCAVLLYTQTAPGPEPAVITACSWAMVVLTCASGIDYIQAWGRKALNRQGTP